MSDLGFELVTDDITLPRGAWAKTRRRYLRWRDRDVLAFTQGEFRPYIHPVYTPAGFVVTAEGPADHPHHNGIWIAADHVHCHVPASGRHELYTYNFCVNQTFQGRAPGRLRTISLDLREEGPRKVSAVQMVHWLGPAEWGAPEGRLVAIEERTVTVHAGEASHIVDLRSSLSATDWNLTLGPTRHAYFSVRVADSMRVDRGGRLHDAEGREGGAPVSVGSAPWVDISGQVGGGHIAGVAVFADPRNELPSWFAADWGVVTLQPFRDNARQVPQGKSLQLATRVVVHDGSGDASLASAYKSYKEAVVE